MDGFKENIQQAIIDSFLLEDYGYDKTSYPKYEDYTLSEWLWENRHKLGKAILKQIAAYDNEEMIEELDGFK